MATLAVVPMAAHAQSETADPGATAGSAPAVSEADDLNEFWAKQRQVRVLQRRLYEKDGDFQLSLGAGVIPNDPFVTYYPIVLRAGYYVTESISLEASGSYIGTALQADSDLGGFLRDEGDYNVFLRDKQRWRGNVVALWSPIYGKFAFAGTKLAHFDWFFGAGFGVLGADSPSQDNLSADESKLKPEAIIATGWNIHLTQRWALRLDVRQFIVSKEGGGVALPTELSLAGSVFF
jgi:outer membrane beta-barrel protein